MGGMIGVRPWRLLYELFPGWTKDSAVWKSSGKICVKWLRMVNDWS